MNITRHVELKCLWMLIALDDTWQTDAYNGWIVSSGYRYVPAHNRTVFLWTSCFCAFVFLCYFPYLRFYEWVFSKEGYRKKQICCFQYDNCIYVRTFLLVCVIVFALFSCIHLYLHCLVVYICMHLRTAAVGSVSVDSARFLLRNPLLCFRQTPASQASY